MAGELLALSGVSKSYRRGDRRVRVLVDAALTVRDREIVAVVGSRGQGKTTLLQIAAGVQKPERGEVRLAGVELTRCSHRERERVLGREVAWVHCEGVALDCKMREYIALSLMVGRGRRKREAEHLAMRALERVGAEGCAESRWGDLSNWERVLVGFARGIVREPRLLIVDDAIDGFGMNKTREAGELLCSFVRDVGCSVLMSASDFEAALCAERVWCFEHGRLKLISDEAGGDAEVIDLHDGERRRQGSGGSSQGA